MGVAIVSVENREAVSQALRTVRMLEDYGFDSVWLSDVVVSPPEYADLTYEMEIMTFTSHLAGKVEKITVGTSALLLPQRNPVIAAKQAATIDILADGKFILGVGAGWRRDEMRFLGINPSLRGGMMDEYIRVIRRLWTEGSVTFRGRFVNLQKATIGIRPLQKSGPPIWVGGNSERAQDRAMRLGNAWHPQNMNPEQLKPRAREFLSSVEGTGRDLTVRVGADLVESRPGPWAQVYGSPNDLAASMNEFSEIGVSHVVLVLGWDVKTVARNVKRFGERVLPKLN